MRTLAWVAVLAVGCSEAVVVDELVPFVGSEVPVAPVWFAGADPAGDMDGDGVPDLADNCPGDYNQSQKDTDLDGLGDVCDEVGIPMDEFSDPNLVGFETYGKWGHTDLTWALESWPEQMTYEEARAGLEDAFAQWAEASALTFSQVGSVDTADIVMSMEAPGDHGDECPFGASTIAHSFFPSPQYPVCPYGLLHFNRDFEFTSAWRATNWEPIDYQSLALHEIGHALGLAHSANNKAVMWKFYIGSRRALHADDVAGIQSLYGGPPTCEPTLTCDDYPGQCGPKSDGCETSLICACSPGLECAGSICIDPCEGVLCPACQACTQGECVATAATDGSACQYGGKSGTCESGICVVPEDVVEETPPAEQPQWVGKPFWLGSNCVVKGTTVKLCVETTGHLGDSVHFVIFEADSQWFHWVTEGWTSVEEKHWTPQTGVFRTCMSWPAWWSNADGNYNDPEYLLKVKAGNGSYQYMAHDNGHMLHVGKSQAPQKSYCKVMQ